MSLVHAPLMFATAVPQSVVTSRWCDIPSHVAQSRTIAVRETVAHLSELFSQDMQDAGEMSRLFLTIPVPTDHGSGFGAG